MSNISTFGTFTIARLGIYASHKAIDIVGNNISNINTEGYSRQVIDQVSLNMGGTDRYKSAMDTRVGSGAFVTGLSQLRDQYLDIRYRDEQASVGATSAKAGGLDEIASVLDEVGRGEDEAGLLEARFNEMIQMMENLAAQGAGRDEFDSLFRSSCTTLVNTLHSYAEQLDVVSTNQEMRFNQEVDQVNTLLTRIRDLNSSIRNTQVYGGNALEQQDERNLLLDQLSEYMRIDITIEKEYLGERKYVDKLVVKTGDLPQRTLVDGIYATRLSVADDAQKRFQLEPLINVNGKTEKTVSRPEVAQMEVDPATLDTQELFKDYPKTVTEGEVEYSASYALKLKEGSSDEYEKDENGDYIVTQTLTPSDGTGETKTTDYYGTLPPTVTVDAKFDSEESAEAQLNNTELFPTSGKDEDGNNVTYSYSVEQNEEDNQYYIMRSATTDGSATLGDTELYGKLQSMREVLVKKGVFSTAEDLELDPNAASKRGIPYYQKALDVLANTLAYTLNECNPKEEPLFSNSTNGNDTKGITAENISISKDWANGSFKVNISDDKDDRSTSNTNLSRILGRLTNDIQFKPKGADVEDPINPDAKSDEVFFTGTFQELFTNHMVGHLANDIKVANTMLNNYETVSNELFVDRNAVMGVDLNDEAIDMMMYQKSFSAACRLMTTFDQMLDKLINGT